MRFTGPQILRSAAIAAWLLLAPFAVSGGRGFRTQHLLEEHYAKYGRDFGPISQDQYLRLAQQLRDSHPGKNILQAKRSDGGAVRFEKRYGWFGAYDPDGTIRTFFVPRDGMRYFERQARGAAAPE